MTRSNLTFRVVDADGKEFALRRPPTSHVLATAHDMVREHTIIKALFPQGIPVPRPDVTEHFRGQVTVPDDGEPDTEEVAASNGKVLEKTS